MTKELAELSMQIGVTISSIIDETANEKTCEYLREKFGEYIKCISQRPDAERAALMLLSAGQVMFGECMNDIEDASSEEWVLATDEAEKLLGIVELKPK